MDEEPIYSRHMLYILYNDINNFTYNGYTVDFNRRLKQHNCILKGGAKFTSKLVKSKNIIWKPLVLIRIKNKDFNQKLALSIEWNIKYPNNKRPRPKEYNNPIGRLLGLKLVFNNPKFSNIIYNIQVFSQNSFDILSSFINDENNNRITIELIN